MDAEDFSDEPLPPYLQGLGLGREQLMAFLVCIRDLKAIAAAQRNVFVCEMSVVVLALTGRWLIGTVSSDPHVVLRVVECADAAFGLGLLALTVLHLRARRLYASVRQRDLSERVQQRLREIARAAVLVTWLPLPAVKRAVARAAARW